MLKITTLLLLPLSILALSPLQHLPEEKPRIHGKHPSPLANFEGLSPRHKLNDTVTPEHYSLKLTILLDEEDSQYGEQFTAPGQVSITFAPNHDNMREVILHANLLNITGVITLTNLNDTTEELPVTFTRSEDDRHYLTLTLTSGLLKLGNSYRIDASFIAPINTEELNGLYLSSYMDKDGNTRRLAATQMQAYHARQAFPCFDEPGLLGTFDLEVTHKANYTATLANGVLLSSDPVGAMPGWVVSTFNRTVPMATYLFALVVSDFSYVEADESLFKFPVRTYAPPPVIERGGGNYSAEIAAKLLSFFDSYFDTEYPMNKMDSVHVPHFDAGAMENWALNLYREVYLIYYPGESLESYKNLLTSVVSHELAHQNFGNRVTAKWWNELHLNEGFATYVSYLGVENVCPEFRHEEWIINDAVQYSMVVDASAASHPIINNAITPSEIDNIFTGITYEKGGSINRMTENFLTKDIYQKGLQYYLRNMSLSAVETPDLMRNLDWAVNDTEPRILPDDLTVEMILDTWMRQKSHPLVRVSEAGANEVYISQERYADPSSLKLWYVPITIATEVEPVLENLVPTLWLHDTTSIITYPHSVTNQGWIMVNVNGTGFYRVLYDARITSLIALQLKEDASVIPPLSRSQLLDDYFTLMFWEYVTIEEALPLTSYLEQENHFTVWEVVFKHLRKSFNYLDNSQDFEAFKNYFLPKVSAALQNAGVEQSPEHIGADGIHRSKVLDWACALGDNECSAYALKLKAQWTDPANNPVPIDIQSSIFCSIVSSQNEANGFNYILAKYKDTTNHVPAVRTRLLQGLACTNDDKVITRLLGMTIADPTELDTAHLTMTLQRVAMSTKGRIAVLEFLSNNLDAILASPIGQDGVRVVLNTLATYLSTQNELNQLMKFISDNGDQLSYTDSLNSNLNTIRSNIVWRKQFGDRIISWMKSNTDVPETSTTNPVNSTPTEGTSEEPSTTENGGPIVKLSLFTISFCSLILAYFANINI